MRFPFSLPAHRSRRRAIPAPWSGPSGTRLSSPAPQRAHFTPGNHRETGFGLSGVSSSPNFSLSNSRLAWRFPGSKRRCPSGRARSGGARGERGRGAQRAGSPALNKAAGMCFTLNTLSSGSFYWATVRAPWMKLLESIRTKWVKKGKSGYQNYISHFHSLQWGRYLFTAASSYGN